MNELKSEDVIKALECCLTLEFNVACKCCPLSYKGERRMDCLETLMKSALALLREKDARLADLAQQCANIIMECDKRDAERLEELMAKEAEIKRLKRKITSEVEDDFPNCSISGCEAADAVCHLTCPYSKELADLKRDAIARLKEKGIDVYIYAMEYDEDGTPYFAFTFDKDKVAEAKEAWEEGSIIKGCYDEYIYGDFYEYELHDMCQTITNRYEREKKE